MENEMLKKLELYRDELILMRAEQNKLIDRISGDIFDLKEDQ